ncbi:VTC domain protein [Gimesia chilikensis]|uniref:VTC domain protein n=1 Tax=Gimesia chilikensis TaxID=2605989 RepID=A0A517WA69_9PLAN|nr:polyphosphate polymerase domain-containing protein [Gimesia chilikensis]QDU02146.1 VTC domain protein [Gimesia chilikensis]
MDLKLFVPETDSAKVYQARDRRIELKFLVTPEVSRQVRNWAREEMDPDPHCTPAIGDSYAINTLYLDTPSLDIFHKTRSGGTTKYRLRRYAAESVIWLETKSKRNNVVQKSRTSIPASQLAWLQQSLPTVENWPGDWFRKRIQQRGLKPSALVHYQRFARVAPNQNQTIRLTIDNRLAGQKSNHWNIPAQPTDRSELCLGGEIIELKFHDILPPLFKRLLLEIPLISTGFSKYRTAVSADL